MTCTAIIVINYMHPFKYEYLHEPVITILGKEASLVLTVIAGCVREHYYSA